MIGIYKVTSPKGSIYIGQTINFKNRINNYRLLKCKKQKKLYNSFLKYGFENHIIELIQECLKEELDSLEIHYIKLYNSYNNGLNLTLGGRPITTLGGKFPEEWKIKMRKPKNLSEKQRQIIGKRMSNYWKGREKSDSWKQSVSKSKNKKIIQYSKTGELIKIWNSVSEAAIGVNISITCISECLTGKQKTSKGYVWKYY